MPALQHAETNRGAPEARVTRPPQPVMSSPRRETPEPSRKLFRSRQFRAVLGTRPPAVPRSAVAPGAALYLRVPPSQTSPPSGKRLEKHGRT